MPSDPPACQQENGTTTARSPEDGSGPLDPAQDATEAPTFRHPQWMVGVVLVFAVAAIVAGLRDPVWWIIGTPCILVLLVYIWVRLRGSARS